MEEKLSLLIIETQEILRILQHNYNRLSYERLNDEISRYNNFIETLTNFENTKDRQIVTNYANNIAQALRNRDNADNDQTFDNSRFLIKLSNIFTNTPRNWLDYRDISDDLISVLLNIIENN